MALLLHVRLPVCQFGGGASFSAESQISLINTTVVDCLAIGVSVAVGTHLYLKTRLCLLFASSSAQTRFYSSVQTLFYMFSICLRSLHLSVALSVLCVDLSSEDPTNEVTTSHQRELIQLLSQFWNRHCSGILVVECSARGSDAFSCLLDYWLPAVTAVRRWVRTHARRGVGTASSAGLVRDSM
eukprot:6184437-Pleurochrysis_carterae.AAC.1